MAGGLKVTLCKGWRGGKENPPIATIMLSLREKVRKTHGPLIQKEKEGVQEKKASKRTEQLSPCRLGLTAGIS